MLFTCWGAKVLVKGYWNRRNEELGTEILVTYNSMSPQRILKLLGVSEVNSLSPITLLYWDMNLYKLMQEDIRGITDIHQIARMII
jgi:hypothetical protein